MVARSAMAGDWKELTELVAEKAKDLQSAYAITVVGKSSYAPYVPMYTLHSTRKEDGTWEHDYAHFGLGGQFEQGQKAQVIVPVTFNVPALSQRLWRSAFRKAHISMTRLPPIFIGPFIRVPLDIPALKSFVPGHEAGGIVSIRMGGPWLGESKSVGGT